MSSDRIHPAEPGKPAKLSHRDTPDGSYKLNKGIREEFMKSPAVPETVSLWVATLPEPDQDLFWTWFIATLARRIAQRP